MSIEDETRDLDGTWWYCEDHHRAERFADDDSKRRIGPFDTREAAEHALETIAERNRRYDAEDEDD